MEQSDGARPVIIAIVGGGIAGLCLALGILNHAPHIHIHIYEAATQFSEIGAGVALGINARRALERLDSRAGAAYRALQTSNVELNVDSDRHKETYVRLVLGMDHAHDPNFRAGHEICEVSCEGGFSSVHRARFLDAMVALLAEDTRRHCVSFGKKLVRIDRDSPIDVSIPGAAASSGVRLHFADGTVSTADAVIGCDGIKSQVRLSLLGPDSPAARAVFTGKYAYRGLVPMDKAEAALGARLARNGHHHLGYGGHVLTFPIDHGETMNVVAFRTQDDGVWPEDGEWTEATTREAMERDLAGWGANVQPIVGLMARCDKWALFDHPPAPTYHERGRICLIGDAAHASTPHQGSGAGMGIEDALVLSSLLGLVQGMGDLHHVFAVFETARKVRTQQLVGSSRGQAMIYDFQAPGVGDDLHKIAEILPSRWDWIWDHDIDKELHRARENLQSRMQKRPSAS